MVWSFRTLFIHATTRIDVSRDVRTLPPVDFEKCAITYAFVWYSSITQENVFVLMPPMCIHITLLIILDPYPCQKC